jgi:hypothetical protein
MTKELIVGPDATNATEQLYDLVGDDELFDRLHALADQDPRANCWNDTEVMNRLAELGVEMPEPTAPGNPAEPQTGATAPVAAAVPPNPVPQQPVAEGDNPATFESTLDTMRKAAGVPILKAALLSAGGSLFDKFTESRLMDSAGETLEHILNRFKHEVKNFEANGDLDDDLYHALYDYYSDNGEMPYGTMKARTGDPYNWISDRLADELGVNEGLMGALAGGGLGLVTSGGNPIVGALGAYAGHKIQQQGIKDPDAEYKQTQKLKQQQKPVAESSCNMTMEGEYCPEHGLAECGGMYEMGTVAGGMAPVIGEGDAVLARIKSLALIK